MKKLVFALALSLIAACSSGPGNKPSGTGGKATGDGKYYLDDGPGASDVDIASIPDAVPKVEPLNRFTNRPYTVLGRTYVPMTAIEPYRARGVASWYGKRYHGEKTSSGEPYDMYTMTAAHTTLPIPSYARVTNLDNGHSIVVKVNDRGPFIDNRLIDLSYVAARKLGMMDRGSAYVEVELIDPRDPSAKAPLVTGPDRPPAPASAPLAHERSGYFLQLGAFDSRDNADSFIGQMAPRLGADSGKLAVLTHRGQFKVQYGPFPSRESAMAAANDLRERLALDSFLVGH